ncbi:hypothetical protein T484DRAFT_1755398 [Baffinella frigidus]|nr:hypothetical protein T484DRAFT_1755398 [Cryptophyta sp. CCMP2293]
MAVIRVEGSCRVTKTQTWFWRVQGFGEWNNASRSVAGVSVNPKLPHNSTRTFLMGDSSKMPSASLTISLTTPEDFVNAFCGPQSPTTSPTARARTYIPLADDLLLCSLGATPRAEDTSANYNAHAGAARWLQRATTPLRGGRRGSEYLGAVSSSGLDGTEFSRCLSGGM